MSDRGDVFAEGERAGKTGLSAKDNPYKPNGSNSGRALDAVIWESGRKAGVRMARRATRPSCVGDVR